LVKIVNPYPGFVGADLDALSAADTELRIEVDRVPGTVIAHFNRARHDTAMAVDAFFLDNFDYRT
jgi:hypothetical protein